MNIYFNADYFKQRGASMLEVLVAMLVMSLGLLGMAALQAATSKYRVNVEAYGEVAQLISALSERIRINPGAAGSSFDPMEAIAESAYVLKSSWSEQSSTLPTAAKDCEKVLCSPVEWADFDLSQWRNRVRYALPQGSAYIDGNRREGVNISIMWMDKELKIEKEDLATGEKNKELKKFPICSKDIEKNIVHNCCPEEAQVPEGVRCLRMSFLP